MIVTALICPGCATGVTGRFSPGWRDLTADQAEFARLFLAMRGNLKEMQRSLGTSYGVLRAHLDAVARRLGGGPDSAPADGGEDPPDGPPSPEGPPEIPSAAARSAPQPTAAAERLRRGGAGGRFASDVMARLERGEIDATTAVRLLSDGREGEGDAR